MNLQLTAFGFGALASGATLGGGLLILRIRPARGLLLAATAGALIGVALFDLLPEAMTAAGGAGEQRTIAALIAIGFAAYLLLERAPLAFARGFSRASIGPASLCMHSLLDGLGIGVAFRADAALGWLVGAAVLAHDLVDGVNTVTLSLEGGGSAARARAWLLADAAAPLVGVALAQFTSLDRVWLARLLGAFCGVFLYIGASGLAPRGGERPTLGVLAASLAAMGALYVVARLIST